jgi:GAF domain-containing protein
LDIDICSVMLSDELTNELTVKSAVGLDEDVIKRTRIKLGDRIAGWVALEGKPLLIEDIETDTRFSKTNISQYTTKSLMTLPLKIGDKVVGVLNLNNKKTAEPFSKEDYLIALQMSNNISHFIELLQSESFSEKDFKRFVVTLGEMLDTEPANRAKKEVLSEFADKILRNSKPLLKLRKSTHYADHS